MPESYPQPSDRPSPERAPTSSGARSLSQFSLATLLFWLTMSAAGAAIIKMFLDRKHRGLDYLLVYMALGSWLAVTWIVILIRVYSPARWKRAIRLRGEMEQLVKQRRSRLAGSGEPPIRAAGVNPARSDKPDCI
jgi:hypothetical protein